MKLEIEKLLNLFPELKLDRKRRKRAEYTIEAKYKGDEALLANLKSKRYLLEPEDEEYEPDLAESFLFLFASFFELTIQVFAQALNVQLDNVIVDLKAHNPKKSFLNQNQASPISGKIHIISPAPKAKLNQLVSMLNKHTHLLSMLNNSKEVQFIFEPPKPNISPPTPKKQRK